MARHPGKAGGAGVLLVAAVAGLVWLVAPRPSAPVVVTGPPLRTAGAGASVPSVLAAGRFPPPFTIPALAPGGAPVSLAAMRGRPVVVNFFAAWCRPCQAELPLLASAARANAGRVRFVGVDVNDVAAQALVLAQSSGVDYPLGGDPTGAVAVRYHLLGLPATVFIAPDGRIAVTHVGQLHSASLAAALGRLTRAHDPGVSAGLGACGGTIARCARP